MTKKKSGNGKPADTAELAPDAVAELTLMGDLFAAMLDELKAAPTVWQKMSEKQQKDVIDRLHNRLASNIRSAVRIIASAGRPTLNATVDQVVFKDGVKAVLTMLPLNPARHDLADAVGRTVTIVIDNAEQFMGGEVPLPDPDQADLIGPGPAAIS